MSRFNNFIRPLALYSQEISHSQQIVGRGGEDEDPGHPVSAAVTGFAEITNGLQPSEDLFHPFSQRLAPHKNHLSLFGSYLKISQVR
jgi:hypothetical protein